MANDGVPHSNGSQFYVTLAPQPAMDNKFVAFGRLIDGTRTLNVLSKTPTINQRPSPLVSVSACGKYTLALSKQ
jgi:cyclophilin family peptidyl-prolyl cis-trans isomerase